MCVSVCVQGSFTMETLDQLHFHRVSQWGLRFCWRADLWVMNACFSVNYCRWCVQKPVHFSLCLSVLCLCVSCSRLRFSAKSGVLGSLTWRYRWIAIWVFTFRCYIMALCSELLIVNFMCLSFKGLFLVECYSLWCSGVEELIFC